MPGWNDLFSPISIEVQRGMKGKMAKIAIDAMKKTSENHADQLTSLDVQPT